MAKKRKTTSQELQGPSNKVARTDATPTNGTRGSTTTSNTSPHDILQPSPITPTDSTPTSTKSTRNPHQNHPDPECQPPTPTSTSNSTNPNSNHDPNIDPSTSFKAFVPRSAKMRLQGKQAGPNKPSPAILHRMKMAVLKDGLTDSTMHDVGEEVTGGGGGETSVGRKRKADDEEGLGEGGDGEGEGGRQGRKKKKRVAETDCGNGKEPVEVEMVEREEEDAVRNDQMHIEEAGTKKKRKRKRSRPKSSNSVPAETNGELLAEPDDEVEKEKEEEPTDTNAAAEEQPTKKKRRKKKSQQKKKKGKQTAENAEMEGGDGDDAETDVEDATVTTKEKRTSKQAYPKDQTTDTENENTPRLDTQTSTASQEASTMKPPHAPYGNYEGYYERRNTTAASLRVDPRLRILDREWFRNAKVLDIGCNSGEIAIQLALHTGASSIEGIDVDPDLILRARANLLQRASMVDVRDENGLVGAGGEDGFGFDDDTDYFPASCFMTMGILPVIRNGKPGFPRNVSFRLGNFVTEPLIVQPDPEDPSHSTPRPVKYDVILALSVSKWIHVIWGDGGLRLFFAKCFAALKRGGRLILEPQAMDHGYRRDRKHAILSGTCKDGGKGLEMRPEDFGKFLVEEIGFSKCTHLGKGENEAKGFQRNILVLER
ncbi:hypothetical protein HDU97_004861 [Phlyctochytrium planicorne]|nr:hypothetical protein HDU97_004861 [Phlyctochytrium planicorne]